MNIIEWATKWGIPPEAILDLQRSLYSTDPVYINRCRTGSEAEVLTTVRFEAAKKGKRLLRNNVGVCQDITGRYIRYGLANDSKQLNEKIKSSDLIGISPVRVEQKHVGSIIGQFTSREIKRLGWSYTGTPEEQAQLAWLELITAFGGDACFATGEGTL